VALAVTALAALGLSFAAATPALAHDELVGQSFATDADDSVTGIVLHYNNDIMHIGAEILVTAPSGELAAAGEPEIAGREVTQFLVLPLETDGTYELAWRVVSSDGHPIQGILAFEVAADGTAEFVLAADPDDDHDHSHEETDTPSDGASASDETPDSEAVTTQSPEEGTGLSAGSLVAVGVVVVLAVGGAIVLVMRRRSAAIRAASADSKSHASAK
jgi:methionine-rich copper-binding protein CopC